jgi:hypothetical protein
LPVLLVFAPGALALDQTASQEEAKRLNQAASDDSLKSSYGNGLQAVNHFFNLNLPGAVSKGVKAYGQYRNSEKLDVLQEKNGQRAGAMGSAGGASPSATKGNGEYVSPYARLDTRFLREGETGAIAAKIEKLSGVPRERMFRAAVDLHERSKSISDPSFLSWGVKTFREVVAYAPNKEFREALQKAGDKAEAMMKGGAAKDVMAQLREQDQGGPPSPSVVESEKMAPEAKSEEGAEGAASEPKRSEEELAKGEESPANAFSSRGGISAESSQQRPGFDRIQFDEKDPFLSGLIQAARKPAHEPTIFQVVSRKIREMSQRQGL